MISIDILAQKITRKDARQPPSPGYSLIYLLMLIILLPLFPHSAFGQNETSSDIIVFGARQDAAPFSYRRQNNKGENVKYSDLSEWNGFTIELCSKIFDQYKEELGNKNLKLKIVPVSAADRFEALKENRIQALCGATTVTIKRMRDHNFTLMTYLSGASVMKRRDTKVETLVRPVDQKKKIRVSVVERTTTKQHVRRLLGASVETVEKSSHEEAFDALREGKVHFYFGDRAILRERLRNAPDKENFLLAPGFLSYEPYAIAIQKNNISLLHAANAALAELYRSGLIYQIYKSWFRDTEMSDLLKAMYEIQKIPE